MNASAWIILSFILFMVVWDVFCMIHSGTEGTISWDMWEVAKEHPIVPFVLGGVMAHWFWRN